MKIIQIIRNWLSSTKPDPVKNCMVYKEVWCTHVDGILCNMMTCDITALKLSNMIDVDVISPNLLYRTQRFTHLKEIS